MDKGSVWKDEGMGESVLGRGKRENKTKHPGPLELVAVTVQRRHYKVKSPFGSMTVIVGKAYKPFCIFLFILISVASLTH